MKISEALTVIAIGLLGLIGSISLWRRVDTMGIHIVAGPGKYLAVVSLVLVACGGFSLVRYRRTILAPATVPVFRSIRGVTLILILFGYALAVPISGFLMGSLFFFPFLFHVSGMRPWVKSILVGLITGALFYGVFVLGAKLPLPKGAIGFR